MTRRRRSSAERTGNRNAAALARAQAAAEQGKVAEYDDVRRLWLVPSLSGRNRARYQTRVVGHPVAGLASAACNCEAGRSQAPQGSTPCWHGATVMVEAALLDLVVFDGRVWRLTDYGQQLADWEEACRPAPPPVRVDKPRHLRPVGPPEPGTEAYRRMVEALVD